ncbi:hypothetical protein GALL_464990 [mine drainage metagenome]|uniref:Uncharacterized protein n=1 Tax=mine drainage metagenome TaxID=410659 RepID=A0A1J5PM52_9ZZZZ
MAGDAMRFAQGVDGVASQIGDRLAHQLIGGTGVKLHIARKGECVGLGLFQWFADIQRLNQRQIIGAGGDQLADAGKDATTLGGA